MKNHILNFMAAFMFFGGTVWAQANQPLVVIAQVKVKAGYEQAFKEAAVRILQPTREEPGNISYDFHQSTENASEFATVEKWRSQEDLATHMNTSHMQAFFKEVGAMFETGYPQIKTYKKFEK